MPTNDPNGFALPIQYDTRPTPPECDCEPSSGCTPPPLPRRDFLKLAGIGVVGVAAGMPQRVMAGPFGADDVAGNHLVPADKKLDPAWVKSLFERGVKEVYRGQGLENIGMPCGGIGCGQLYLCGDGTLGCWQIFNNGMSNWVGQTNSTYEHRGIPKPVRQGFAVIFTPAGGEAAARELSSQGFADVSFKGEYPIATINYADADSPVAVETEAFSPFIPLSALESAFPATVFNITVKNTSQQKVTAGIAGWLENAVCSLTATFAAGSRHTEISRQNGQGLVRHWANETQPETPVVAREPVVFEDFEAGNYDKWTVEGAAFGDAPATGAFTADKQSEVSGFEGAGLVNTFRGGDAPEGRLLSKPFKITHNYINLKVGGGPHRERTYVSLLVDGKAVRTVAGLASETLAWSSWVTSPLIGQEAQIEIVDAAGTGWGHILVDQIEFSDAPRANVVGFLAGQRDYGTMALLCRDAADPTPAVLKALGDSADAQFVDSGKIQAALGGKLIGRLHTPQVELKPGEHKTFTFVLAWHFPNGEQGNYYAVRFPSAAAVAQRISDDFDALTAKTRLWRDTYYDSTLPYWLLDRLHSTASTLATETCRWWANGRFWAFEGVTCCAGTCTHVWNYAHLHARLFPEIGRNIRAMQDFNPRQHDGGYHPETGLVGFRSDDGYAADGQCGTILKAYREHQMSADNSFLHRFWPRIKQALQFAIAQDGDNDGLIENTQHNTYDINYHGANTFVGALYLAALRAGEEMAREVGDEAFADHCRAIFETGSRLTVRRLWDGEYFIQDVDLDKYPNNQYGRGCLSDHLFGQGWAHQVDLGYLYPADKVRSAMQAIWKYNWAPDVQTYNNVHKPFRWFISPGQAGLFTCTWPKSDYLSSGTMYRNEVWTGIEYQVAGHMIAEGMVTEGLAICRAIHERYQPELYNPYNEIECGDHYARALASWGVYLSLAGFKYHGPQQRLGFAPRITPEKFRCAFTAAEGWGTFDQSRDARRQTNQIIMRYGRLALRTLKLEPAAGMQPTRVEVTLAGRRVAAEFVQQGAQIAVQFADTLTIDASDALTVELIA